MRTQKLVDLFNITVLIVLTVVCLHSAASQDQTAVKAGIIKTIYNK